MCLTCAFWNIKPLKIIEFIEAYRLLGVSKIYIYDNDLYSASLKTFKKYEKIGLVKIRNFRRGYFDTRNDVRQENSYKSQASPAINDCILRHMYKYRKLIVVDLDEFIMPHRHDNFHEMLNYLNDHFPSSHPGRSYVFRNAYFFSDFRQNNSFPPALLSLRTRIRVEVSKPGYSVKSIIDPQACIAMHNHVCWKYSNLFNIDGKYIEVPPDIGLLHHYKKCHFNALECGEMLAQPINDKTITRFEDRLLNNIKKRASQFNVTFK